MTGTGSVEMGHQGVQGTRGEMRHKEEPAFGYCFDEDLEEWGLDF